MPTTRRKAAQQGNTDADDGDVPMDNASAAAAGGPNRPRGASTAQEKAAMKKFSEMSLNESDEKLKDLFHIANYGYRIVLATQQSRLVWDHKETFDKFMQYAKERSMCSICCLSRIGGHATTRTWRDIQNIFSSLCCLQTWDLIMRKYAKKQV